MERAHGRGAAWHRHARARFAGCPDAARGKSRHNIYGPAPGTRRRSSRLRSRWVYEGTLNIHEQLLELLEKSTQQREGDRNWWRQLENESYTAKISARLSNGKIPQRNRNTSSLHVFSERQNMTRTQEVSNRLEQAPGNGTGCGHRGPDDNSKPVLINPPAVATPQAVGTDAETALRASRIVARSNNGRQCPSLANLSNLACGTRWGALRVGDNRRTNEVAATGLWQMCGSSPGRRKRTFQ